MNRADAWSDAQDILEEQAGYIRTYAISEAVAMRTSLTCEEADAKIWAGIVSVVGELLLDYGKEGQ